MDIKIKDQYEGARQSGDALLSRLGKVSGETAPHPAEAAPDTGFCTETLAGIYLEQGYRQEALDIYSRLSLRYPEKSVYFAALIDEINKKDN